MIPTAARGSMARILGVGMTPISQGSHEPAVNLMVQALALARADANLDLADIDGLIALPSLVSDQHFMIAHEVAQQAGLVPRKGVIIRTLDVGGAGPIAGLLAAKRMIQMEGRKAVAVVCGDAVASVPTEAFLKLADGSCIPRQAAVLNPSAAAAAGDGGGAGSRASSSSSSRQREGWREGVPPSPVIPHLYDRVASWQMEQYGLKREQLAMVASLMTHQASHHPGAIHKRPRKVEEVLSSGSVAPVTSRLECAKRADGGAAVIVVSPQLLEEKGISAQRAPAILGGGEGSGPLYPPQHITEAMFSAGEAVAAAYKEAGCSWRDIQYWGLYDCFPICFIRALEAVGLAGPGQGGEFVEAAYHALFAPARCDGSSEAISSSSRAGGLYPPEEFDHQQLRHNSDPRPHHQHHQQQEQKVAVAPLVGGVLPINTHGGLLGFGAPWEVPAMHSLIEAVVQLRGEAHGRQVQGARQALVYGNGGIFSSSAVAILGSDGGGSGEKASYHQQQHQAAQQMYAGKL